VPFLVLLFIVVPIAELYVIIQVGQAIGVLATVGLLFLDSVAGSFLMRHQGRAVWRKFRLAIQEGRTPAKETIDGGLVLMGGALLLTPGFLSDILGALMLLPPTRAIIRRMLARRFLGGMVASMQRPPPTARPGRSYDIDGTATDRTPEP
jgi:UPF0716 protein FxsA